MARLSFGSQHFQANGRHSTLLTDNAERISSVPDLPKEDAFVNDDSTTTIETTTDFDSRNTPLRQNQNTPAESNSEVSKLRAQIANLSKYNDELIDENTGLREENRKLAENNEKLRQQISVHQTANSLDELESTVLSSFAKILKDVRNMKSVGSQTVEDNDNHACLELATVNKEPIEEELSINDLDSHKDSLATAVKPEDYSAFTFFKPLQNRKNLTNSNVAGNKDFSDKLKLQSPFTFTKKELPQSEDNSFSMEFGSNLRSRHKQKSDHDELVDTEDNSKIIISSSTPRKNDKKSTITDIYGDEIPLRRQKGGITRHSPQISQETQAGIVSVNDHPQDSDAMKETTDNRRALSNITNKKRKKNFYKLQPASPVGKGFFDYVDESVLMEQTQNSVKHVKNRFKPSNP